MGFALTLGDITQGIFAVIFLLGVLIFIHELGHYAMAKLFGVRVETFSLGFGKRLWGFRRGETDYRISILPLGGYVKMAGENPMEERTGDPGEFMSHPRWQRFIIAIAGPVMNILLAVAVLTGLYKFHYEPPPVGDVGWVGANSPAAKAGIQPGDRILKIDGIQNPRWDDVERRVAYNPNQPIEVTVRRGDQIVDKRLTPVPFGPDQVGYAGWEPPDNGVIEQVTPGAPAAKAGLKTQDTIIALNSAPIQSIHQVLERLQEIKDSPAQLTILRDGKEMNFTLRAHSMDINGDRKYRIGIVPGRKRVIEQLPLRQAFATALAECRKNSTALFEIVPKMIRGKNSIKQVSGPVRIMEVAAVTSRDVYAYTYFMAVLSINLAVFNLLPIPILDGGLMLMLLIESIMRRDIKQEVKERVYQAAFVFLVLFAAVVIFNDVAKHF
ncbi:MAG TPA: RIP metalloprotease RseP [Terriglobales bacterium]|nr:RIP metalloprotease RseP [Terriglobales bacterium]